MLDVFSRRVASRSIGKTMTADRVLGALSTALGKRRGAAGSVIHYFDDGSSRPLFATHR